MHFIRESDKLSCEEKRKRDRLIWVHRLERNKKDVGGERGGDRGVDSVASYLIPSQQSRLPGYMGAKHSLKT